MHAPLSQMFSLTLGENQEVVLSKVLLKKLSEFRLGSLRHQPYTSSKLSKKKQILQPGFSRKLVLLYNCHFSENIFPYTESAPPHRISPLIPTLFCRESPILFSAFLFCRTCITRLPSFNLPCHLAVILMMLCMWRAILHSQESHLNKYIKNSFKKKKKVYLHSQEIQEMQMETHLINWIHKKNHILQEDSSWPPPYSPSNC